VVGICADALRHPAETLKDVESLLKKGVDPNALDNLGITPLRKCIEQGLATDVVPLVRKLLDGGADPEYEDVDGVQPYSVAARTLAEPVRSDILQAMLAKMRGSHTKTKDGRTYRWDSGLFPIPDDPTYQQVLSCTKPDDNFQLSMHEMVPIDVQPAFQRAYFAVTSSRVLERITQDAMFKTITEKDRWDILLVLSLRKAANLPNYQFDQGLVITLLDFPKISTAKLSSTPAKPSEVETSDYNEDTTPHSTLTPDSAMPDVMPAYQPFQLNTNSSSNSSHPSPLLKLSHESGASNDAFVGDTTQVRWLNPEAKRPPSDTKKTASYVVQYRCSVCADDRLLTKTEIHKHEVEHAHTTECDDVGCARRFCRETRRRREKEVGCQDHLFQGII
jgi:hypothetical protein